MITRAIFSYLAIVLLGFALLFTSSLPVPESLQLIVQSFSDMGRVILAVTGVATCIGLTVILGELSGEYEKTA